MEQHNTILDAPIDETPAPEIYSSSAVAGFTFFFSTIFGGIMAYQNLNRVGKNDIAIKVLLGSIAFMVALVALQFVIDIPRGVGIPINLATSWVMGKYLHDQYIPGHESMPKRKIWVPLAIGLALIGIIIWSIFSGANF